MFVPTRPFKDKITGHPTEPSLRIGKVVPPDAVNLAYYYNKQATDAEKILAAEAPRQTIDHRVEEAYRYLINQSSPDDDLFPGSVWYEDEEGYSGRLGRMYVLWHEEVHINQESAQETRTQIVNEKDNILKMIEYNGPKKALGYTGNLYLDAVDYEVTKEKDVSTVEYLDYEVYNHELSYNVIHGKYLSPDSVDAWMKEPGVASNTMWPASIMVDAVSFKPSGGHAKVQEWIKAQKPNYDDAYGILVFDKVEYEQVPNPNFKPKNGEIEGTKTIKDKNKFRIGPYKFTGDIAAEDSADQIKDYIEECRQEAIAKFGQEYDAVYNKTTDQYEYDEINDFLAMAAECCGSSTISFMTKIQEQMGKNKDIVIYLDRIDMTKPAGNAADGEFYFYPTYKWKTSRRAEEGQYLYNVIARYKGMLTRAIITDKKVPAEYKATAVYTGLIRRIWYDYDGMAYYRGSVTKGQAVGNVNPDGDNELLMYSDDDGWLRIPKGVDKDGKRINFYRVESDQVYITDVFSNGKACFYKYPLKKPIYDYRGPDFMGFYEGDTVQMFTAALKDLPDGYEHGMKLRAADYELVETNGPDNTLVSHEEVRRYNAELYTSFISSATDTFKVVYNAYDDNNEDNIALENGVTEDVYGYPFMHKNVDYNMIPVDVKARVNKIKLKKPCYIEDTRRYVTFKYKIVATRAENADPDNTTEKTFESNEFDASILNKDYAVAAEHAKFDGRAMIISPLQEGLEMSPLDICLTHQSNLITEEASNLGVNRDEIVPSITKKNSKFFTFKAVITHIDNLDRGAVNLKCNPDGSGLITAETTIDTGFMDEITGTYTQKLAFNNPYYIENGRIYPGFKVKCIDTRFIKAMAPREERLLDSWYPRMQFGHYSQILDQYGAHIKVCYTMPEYDTQHWGALGNPFVDVVDEKVEILNSHMVKTICYPLLVREDLPGLIKVWKRVGDERFEIKIKDISFSDGIIITTDTVSENDDIICSYTYLETSYVYRGYWRNENDFARIDLNPNKYHTYSDLNYVPSETKPSKNLFNKVIYFFMRPRVIYEVDADNDSLIYHPEDDTDIGTITEEHESCLYHQIDNAEPESDRDIYIGSIYIRQNTSLHSTILVDSRTRGGGVLESMKDSLRKELEPESDYYLDIGYYDGEPYQENGVVIIRLDNSILQEFGGRFTPGDIEQRVKRWIGAGVYPIIEYVDSYSKHDMPQYNLEVEDSYTNVTDETPEIMVECLDVS